jgi:putative endonuclease
LKRILEQSRKKGAAYERLAAAFLQKKGYEILKRNYYSPQGEIDLIARDGEYLVFVEVKYRADSRYGHPLETVDTRKQRRIKGAARWYLRENGPKEETACRFDVVGMLKDEIIHVENAF